MDDCQVLPYRCSAPWMVIVIRYHGIVVLWLLYRCHTFDIGTMHIRWHEHSIFVWEYIWILMFENNFE